jgi:hypothetical protein
MDSRNNPRKFTFNLKKKLIKFPRHLGRGLVLVCGDMGWRYLANHLGTVRELKHTHINKFDLSNPIF